MIHEDLSKQLRLRQAVGLLRDAAENIVAARLLLEACRYSPSPFARNTFNDAMPFGKDFAPEILPKQHQPTTRSKSPNLSNDWSHIDLSAQDARLTLPQELVNLVNMRLMLVGPGCARVLLRLMAEPDQMITVAELARASDIQSHSTRVIKVYICRLRRALVVRGIPAAAIDTGPGSYSLRAALFPSLADFLAGEWVPY